MKIMKIIKWVESEHSRVWLLETHDLKKMTVYTLGKVKRLIKVTIMPFGLKSLDLW